MIDSKALIIRSELDIMTLGKLLSQSGFFQDTREASQAVVKVLAGQELGFGPIASMNGINIIRGRVSLGANLMAAAIKRSGKYNYRVISHDDKKCQIKFFENDVEIGISEYTLEDAQKAGLVKSDSNWKKFPRNMVFARAISNGAKWFCPDVFNGPVYTPDELGADVDGETGDIIEAQFETRAKDGQIRQPLLPEKLLVKLETTIKAKPYIDSETGDPLPVHLHSLGEQAAKLVAAKWTEALGGNKDAYHTSLMATFSQESAKNITAGQANALLSWLLNGKTWAFDTPVVEPAPKEATALYHWAKEQADIDLAEQEADMILGQTTLPGSEETASNYAAEEA